MKEKQMTFNYTMEGDDDKSERKTHDGMLKF